MFIQTNAKNKTNRLVSNNPEGTVGSYKSKEHKSEKALRKYRLKATKLLPAERQAPKTYQANGKKQEDI